MRRFERMWRRWDEAIASGQSPDEILDGLSDEAPPGGEGRERE